MTNEDNKPAVDEKDTGWKIALADFADRCLNDCFNGLYLRIKLIITLKDAVDTVARITDFMDGFEHSARLSGDIKLIEVARRVSQEADKLLRFLHSERKQRLALME
jgi:hypothetical protein